MKTLIFQVAVGEVKPFYHTCMNSVEQYAERVGADYKRLTEPVLKIAPLNSHRSANALRLGYLPILEKEQAFAYLSEYDIIGIIDADVYVRDGIPNVFEEIKEDTCLAAVREIKMPLTPQYTNKVRKFSKAHYGFEHPFFNLGVMFVTKNLLPYLNGQTPEQFLRRKEFRKYINGEGHFRWSTDQSMINQWLLDTKMKTQDLDWKWNALVKAVRDDALSQAYFLHFFLSAKYPQKGNEIPQIVKNIDRVKNIKGHG